jgi:hypothetical protein
MTDGSKGKAQASNSLRRFSYDDEPLDTSKGQIRLLELFMDEEDDDINCHVFNTTIEDAPVYEALLHMGFTRR